MESVEKSLDCEKLPLLKSFLRTVQNQGSLCFDQLLDHHNLVLLQGLAVVLHHLLQEFQVADSMIVGPKAARKFCDHAFFDIGVEPRPFDNSGESRCRPGKVPHLEQKEGAVLPEKLLQ